MGEVVPLQQQIHFRRRSILSDPKRSEYIVVDDIEVQTPSTVSPMPRGLIDVLNSNELVDLIGYLSAASER